jgi:arginase
MVVTVGGTCGVEAAPVAYLNERYAGDLAIVWFDAHGDLNAPDTSPSGHFHGHGAADAARPAEPSLLQRT